MESPRIPKYPHITARLVGQDGNVFNLIGIVSNALRAAGVSKQDRDDFYLEVIQAGSYDEALQVMMRWVEVE